MKKKNNKIIAIIPARGGSKAIPKKNLQLLHGKPLIAWPIKLAKSVKRIERVIVSTDNNEIMTTSQKYGAEILFKRPAELAKDETPIHLVLQHCIRYLEKKEKYRPDIIVLLTPTSPFLTVKRVNQALDFFKSAKCNSVVSVVKDYGHFWTERNGRLQRFYPLKLANRQYSVPLYRENGAIYFSRYKVIINMNKLVDDQNTKFLLMEEDENIDIDTPLDLARARKKSPPRHN